MEIIEEEVQSSSQARGGWGELAICALHGGRGAFLSTWNLIKVSFLKLKMYSKFALSHSILELILKRLELLLNLICQFPQPCLFTFHLPKIRNTYFSVPDSGQQDNEERENPSCLPLTIKHVDLGLFKFLSCFLSFYRK
jgi:hypothetical protein